MEMTSQKCEKPGLLFRKMDKSILKCVSEIECMKGFLVGVMNLFFFLQPWFSHCNYLCHSQPSCLSGQLSW